MRVRKQNEIDPRKLARGEGRRGQSLRTDRETREADANARKKDGVGDDVDSAEVDQHGRVTDPCGGHAGVVPRKRIRPCEGRRDRSQALDRPFAPEVGEPVSPGFRGSAAFRHGGTCAGRRVAESAWGTRQNCPTKLLGSIALRGRIKSCRRSKRERLPYKLSSILSWRPATSLGMTGGVSWGAKAVAARPTARDRDAICCGSAKGNGKHEPAATNPARERE